MTGLITVIGLVVGSIVLAGALVVGGWLGVVVVIDAIRDRRAATRRRRTVDDERIVRDAVDEFNRHVEDDLRLFRPGRARREAGRGWEWDRRRPLPGRYPTEPAGAPLSASERSALAEIEAAWREDGAA